jgi:hypothetical protein
MFLVGNLSGFPKRPTESVRQQISDITGLVSGYVDKVNSLIDEDIPELNKILETNNLKVIKAPKRVEI